mgnify:CR=1 FL=1
MAFRFLNILFNVQISCHITYCDNLSGVEVFMFQKFQGFQGFQKFQGFQGFGGFGGFEEFEEFE